MSDLTTDDAGLTTPGDWRCASCGTTRVEHGDSHVSVRERVPFVGMLRVRNEERWIVEALESTLPLCRSTFVMDDHSDDQTVEICQRYAPQVRVLPSVFAGLNESRDKNWLLDQIMAVCEPEWIACIDGDEVLERRDPDII